MNAIKKKVLDNERLSILCTELSEILRSGITISEGFLLVSEQERDGSQKQVYEALYRETQEGGAVGAAMRRTDVFPEYMLRMIGVAEETGALERVLRELAEYYDRQERLRRTIRSTVSYPLLLFFIVLAVFFVFLTEVLPVFDRVFAQIGASMLPVALVFLKVGLWLAKAKWWIVGIIGSIAAAAVLVRSVPALNEKASAAAARIFSGTKTGETISDFRLAAVISLAVTGTSDIVEALELAYGFAEGGNGGNRVRETLEMVMGGTSFAAAAERAGLFSPVYCRMLLIGERAGSVESIMKDIARRAQTDMEVAVTKLTGRIEPAAVIILSVCVGLLLLSVMLPLVGIMSAL